MPKVKDLFEEAAEIGNTNATDDDDDGTANEDDQDTCAAAEIEQCFSAKCRISAQLAVSLKKDYVLSLCQDGGYSRLAAGLSNGGVQIIDINDGRSLSHASVAALPPPISDASNEPINICGVQFLDDESPDCLLVGTSNGLVRLYDLRTQRIEASFEEDVENVDSKNISCFERNSNSRVLCTGTEQYQNTVYQIFYDIRERKQMGVYSESHQDDITTIRFHPQNPDLLCSGSTDGLINIFNIKETCEDDALLTTLNTESSVHKLNWHKNVYEKDILSCITHTNDFKVYDCEEGDLIVEFGRDQITDNMKRKNAANCNLVNAHSMDDGGVFLVAGTNFKRGEILRTLLLQNKELLPLADFDGNRQIIRDSLFNPKNRCLITAGESGILTLWTPESLGPEDQSAANSKLRKSKEKRFSKKVAPY